MSDPPAAPVPTRAARASGWWIGCSTVLVLLGIGVVLVLTTVPIGRVWEEVRRGQCQNKLRQIGRALHEYHDVYGAFPPAYTVDADGNPLHSWRTLILPFLDEKPLYDSIDLSKPWDHAVNVEAREQALSVYRCPSADVPEHHTTYLAIAAPNGCFRPGAGRKLSEITDGPAFTLMVSEVPTDRSVPWMSPRDADEALILSNWRGGGSPTHRHWVYALTCDGRLCALLPMSASELGPLISISGNDEVPDF